MLDPGRGRTKTGQMWAEPARGSARRSRVEWQAESYARDDRPWSGPDPPAVAFVYAADRKAERPIAHLASFTGVLQVNGYAG